MALNCLMSQKKSGNLYLNQGDAVYFLTFRPAKTVPHCMFAAIDNRLTVTDEKFGFNAATPPIIPFLIIKIPVNSSFGFPIQQLTASP